MKINIYKLECCKKRNNIGYIESCLVREWILSRISRSFIYFYEYKLDGIVEF